MEIGEVIKPGAQGAVTNVEAGEGQVLQSRTRVHGAPYLQEKKKKNAHEISWSIGLLGSRKERLENRWIYQDT